MRKTSYILFLAVAGILKTRQMHLYLFPRAVTTKSYKQLDLTVGIYHPTVQEAGSLKSRCWHALSRAARILFCLFQLLGT